MKKNTILLTFIIFSITCFSQINTIDDYLNDKGRSDAKDIVKTDLSEILKANMQIIWEHRFQEHFALQSGIGFLTNSYFQPIVRPLASNYPYNKNIGNGFSLYVQPVYYFRNYESLHTGLKLYYKQHFGQATSFEYGLSIGKQWFWGRHFAIDIESGIGINLEYSLDGHSYIFNPDILNKSMAESFRSRLSIPLCLKIGYVL